MVLTPSGLKYGRSTSRTSNRWQHSEDEVIGRWFWRANLSVIRNRTASQVRWFEWQHSTVSTAPRHTAGSPNSRVWWKGWWRLLWTGSSSWFLDPTPKLAMVGDHPLLNRRNYLQDFTSMKRYESLRSIHIVNQWTNRDIQPERVLWIPMNDAESPLPAYRNADRKPRANHYLPFVETIKQPWFNHYLLVIIIKQQALL